jgi:hypothetical protein
MTITPGAKRGLLEDFPYYYRGCVRENLTSHAVSVWGILRESGMTYRENTANALDGDHAVGGNAVSTFNKD